jgi:chromate transporter
MTEPPNNAGRPSVGLVELALGFGKVAVLSFGGGLTAWARLVIVEQRKWLEDEEFLSALTFCRVLPGPNQLNMAVYVGARLRGFPGVMAAVLGLWTLPFLIILGLGIAYFHYHDVPEVRQVLRGVTAASVGMTLAMGIKVGARYFKRIDALVFITVAFVAAGIMRWPLLPTLAVLGPLAVYWYWPRLPAEKKEA